MIATALPRADLASLERKLSGLRTVEVSLTQTCNLACDYCNIAHNITAAQKGSMGPGLIERIAAFAGEHAAADGVEVVITGGEPLSHWPAVTTAVGIFSRVLGGRLRALRIETNATLVRPERATWLAEHNVTATVGIDGPEPTHDAHRTNSAGIGSWRRSAQGVVALTAAGVPVDVALLVTADTFSAAPASIDWICGSLHPLAVRIALAAPPTLARGGDLRPPPESWADLLVEAHARWSANGVRLEPVATVAEALAGGPPILHSDDGAWGGAICVDVDGHAGPNLALLCAGVGRVDLDSADLASGPFQQWRDRAPVRNPGCASCPAVATCGNTTMYASAAYAGSPAARDEWHCRMQRRLLVGVAALQ